MPIRLTQAVKVLLIICFALFLVQQTGDQFLGTHLIQQFALTPFAFLHQQKFWQLFTYSFFHHDVMHLFFNLLMLAFIGGELEIAWGTKRFLQYYFFCTTCAGLIYLLIGGASAPMIGASGGIYGLLMAYGLIFGERVLLFMMLFPMKAKHFIWVLVLLELLTTVYSSGGGAAGVAQLGGMAAGFCYLWGRALWIQAKKKNSSSLGSYLKTLKKKRARHLKLIINNDPEDFDSKGDDPEDKPKTWH